MTNACECGSGRTHRECHGHYFNHLDLLSPAAQEISSIVGNSDFNAAIALSHKREYGYGRLPESWVKDDVRHVRVNNITYKSAYWRTFNDFLFSFLQISFGRDWWQAERSKPLTDRHPVVQQFTQYEEAEKASSRGSSGLFSIKPSGPMAALMALAYDLYLCAHNEKIPKPLLERLKSAQHYEGALYEAHVIGIFARAGFEIAFEDETDKSQSHCEFTATNKGTGRKFSVEAKAVTSRSARAGASAEPPRLRGKLYDALLKQADHPRMIFIEINRAISPKESVPEWAPHFVEQVRQAEIDMMVGDTPAAPAYLYVTNRPLLVGGAKAKVGYEVGSAGFKIADFPPERLRGIINMQRARMLHIEAYQVFQAMQQLSSVPNYFSEHPIASFLRSVHSEKRAKGFRHPLDAFDFLFRTYHRTDKNLLIEWMSDYVPPWELNGLNQLQLAELYCAGMAETMFADLHRTAR
ncbi:hypothetical protein [Mesorhizobium sp. M1143]|uniref:hypothetical protein n=1 Tax=Mesorhizobium sp. M1143 TaxID=2957061 RepID=UPI0033367CD8